MEKLDNETLELIKASMEPYFMSRRECDRKTDKMHENIESIKIDMAKIRTLLSVIATILGAIGTAICATLIPIFFGG